MLAQELLFRCKQERFPSRLVQICAANTALRQSIPLNHTQIMHSHICSLENDDIFTVIKTMKYYQNFLVYSAIFHMCCSCCEMILPKPTAHACTHLYTYCHEQCSCSIVDVSTTHDAISSVSLKQQ